MCSKQVLSLYMYIVVYSAVSIILTEQVYIIEHDRPRCHNVVVALVCFSNDYRIILVD
jgi:hypothetical protein